eukprot:2159456-Pyramimonas_sp.AAC.1
MHPESLFSTTKTSDYLPHVHMTSSCLSPRWRQVRLQRTQRLPVLSSRQLARARCKPGRLWEGGAIDVSDFIVLRRQWTASMMLRHLVLKRIPWHCLALRIATI